MSEIKRCPFCGGEATLTNKLSKDEYGQRLWNVCCFGCANRTSSYWDKEIAIEAWNTRKPLERVIERLEEQAEECKKYWDEFDDEDAFGGMNAYMNSIEIIKQEMM